MLMAWPGHGVNRAPGHSEEKTEGGGGEGQKRVGEDTINPGRVCVCVRE